MTSSNGVAFIIADMAGGGAQQVVSRIMNAWAADGIPLALLTLQGPENDAYPIHNDIRRVIFGSTYTSYTLAQRLKNNIHQIKSLRNALKIINCKTAISFIAPTNIQLILASYKLGYRIIISERNDPSRQSFGVFKDYLRRRLYKKADLVTANSHGALRSLSAFVPNHKLAFLPNPLRPEIETQSLDKHQRQPVFLNIGRLHPQKGQDFLIKAFSLISDELPEWSLHIAGEGGERKNLEQLMTALGLQNRVKLLGHHTHPQQLYETASVFVFPSRHEGTPNALMEAMACGMAVIASQHIPDCDRLVEHNKSGLVILPENIEDLASAMKQTALSKDLRADLGAQAKMRAEHFKLQHVIQHWNSIVFS